MSAACNRSCSSARRILPVPMRLIPPSASMGTTAPDRISERTAKRWGVNLKLMQREQIVFVGTSDLSGHFRGKSFPAADLPSRLQRGVGLAPTNIFVSAFGPIQMTTFGTVGEVFLIPDPSTRVFVPFEDGAPEYFFIGDIQTLEGEPWAFCPRHILRRALDRLKSETGLCLLAAFEQEFTYSGVAAHPWRPFGLDAYRSQGRFGEALLAAMR